MTFTNGYVTGNGGAINNEGNLIIHDSKFINNRAGEGGAAIRSSINSKLEVYDSEFESNNALFGTAIDSYHADTIVVNSIFTNNVAHEGGAIYNRFSDFQLINSTFINNSAARGGGIYNNRGYLVIRNSKFYSNNASHLGGGVKSWGFCEIYDSIIRDNVGEYGGGVYISEFSMKIQNCEIENNRADEGGGIIADAYGNLTIINSRINNNHAIIGGGIDGSWGYISVIDCSLDNNSATDKGGGIACVNFEADVQSTILTNNRANNGGGLYVGKISANFSNCTLNNNIATEYGGAIYNIGDLALDNSNFDSNKGFIGGAVYNEQSFTVTNSLFAKNYANDAGVIYTSSNLTIGNSKFQDNNVGHSLGIIYVIKGYANISNSIFTLNKGSDEGGVIFNNFGVVSIDNSQFISNRALSYGGAIDNSATLTISNSLFDGNQAYGAGAIDNGGNLTIINSKFINNKATRNGGAVDNKGDMVVIGSIFENNTADGNGGAIIARRGTSVSYSIIYNNKDSKGYAIFNETWDQNSFENNWWGENNPDFTKLFNFDISDNFTWIIMNAINTSPIIQNRDGRLKVSLDEITTKDNIISKIESPNSLPKFDLRTSFSNNIISISNGVYEGVFSIPKVDKITVSVNNQHISFNTNLNQYYVKENKNIVMDYNGKTTYKVRIVDSFGAICPGFNVVMKISGKSYNVKTDGKGYATKTFSLTPGKYTIYVTCDGKTVSNKITVNKVLKAKGVTKKKAKKIKYSASLKTSKGKAIVGKKITFKIKGKTYNAKTNKKGIATVTLKNLKVGTYKITVTYLKSKVQTKLRIKR